MANRYWVGGTGTWNAVSTANWAATSGGASGASAPTSADIVFIDANSGSGTITLGANIDIVRFDGRTSAINLDWNTYKISINGSGTTVWYSGGITATGTAEAKVEFTYSGANSRTINPRSGVGENTAISVYVTAGTGNFVISTGGSGLLQNLNFTGFSGLLLATTATSSWTIYGDLTLSSTMTMPTMTGAFLLRGVLAPRTVTSNGKAFNQPVTVNAPSNTISFADALTCTTFTYTDGTVKLKNGVTSTVGSLTTSGTNQKFLQSTLAGSQATLSQSTGIVSVGYLTIKDINATGGATFNAYTVNSNVNAGNNLGWDFFAQLGKTIYTRRKEKRVLI
jgi:hypothetical protein